MSSTTEQRVNGKCKFHDVDVRPSGGRGYRCDRFLRKAMFIAAVVSQSAVLSAS